MVVPACYPLLIFLVPRLKLALRSVAVILNDSISATSVITTDAVVFVCSATTSSVRLRHHVIFFSVTGLELLTQDQLVVVIAIPGSTEGGKFFLNSRYRIGVSCRYRHF